MHKRKMTTLTLKYKTSTILQHACLRENHFQQLQNKLFFILLSRSKRPAILRVHL